MIRGIYENFAPPWGVQGGAQGAGCLGGANYSFEFWSFLVPISVSFPPVLNR